MTKPMYPNTTYKALKRLRVAVFKLCREMKRDFAKTKLFKWLSKNKLFSWVVK